MYGYVKEPMMNRRQFLILFLCSLMPWWVGSGLMPLLPLYAARLGASPALVGNYLSLIFFALAAGTVLGGWIAAKVRSYRALMMAMAAVAASAAWLMGQTPVLWQFILLNTLLWFVNGISLALVMIIAGQITAQQARGRTFGLLAMTSALGGVLGGPTGFIADRWGYPLLFTLAAGIMGLQLVAAVFLRNPTQPAPAPTSLPVEPRVQPRHRATPASAFLLLVAAALLFSTGGFAGTLGRSLAMEAQGFAGSTITLIAAMGSAIGLMVNPLIGRYSDRVDRRPLLCLIYLAGGLALVVMAYANSVGDFMVVAVLTALSGAERSVSAALASDLLPAQGLGRGLSLFDGVKWIGGVVGLAGTGYVIQSLGVAHALLVSALLPVFALVLILFLRKGDSNAAPVPAPQLEAT
jgi:MFS family permease